MVAINDLPAIEGKQKRYTPKVPEEVIGKEWRLWNLKRKGFINMVTPVNPIMPLAVSGKENCTIRIMRSTQIIDDDDCCQRGAQRVFMELVRGSAIADDSDSKSCYISCRSKSPVHDGSFVSLVSAVGAHEVFEMEYSAVDNSFIFKSWNGYYLHYNETANWLAFNRCSKRIEQGGVFLPVKGRWELLGEEEVDRAHYIADLVEELSTSIFQYHFREIRVLAESHISILKQINASSDNLLCLYPDKSITHLLLLLIKYSAPTEIIAEVVYSWPESVFWKNEESGSMALHEACLLGSEEVIPLVLNANPAAATVNAGKLGLPVEHYLTNSKCNEDVKEILRDAFRRNSSVTGGDGILLVAIASMTYFEKDSTAVEHECDFFRSSYCWGEDSDAVECNIVSYERYAKYKLKKAQKKNFISLFSSSHDGCVRRWYIKVIESTVFIVITVGVYPAFIATECVDEICELYQSVLEKSSIEKNACCEAVAHKYASVEKGSFVDKLISKAPDELKAECVESPKIHALNAKIEELKLVMHENIKEALEKTEKLEEIEKVSAENLELSKLFKKTSNELSVAMWMKNNRMLIAAGTMAGAVGGIAGFLGGGPTGAFIFTELGSVALAQALEVAICATAPIIFVVWSSAHVERMFWSQMILLLPD